METNGFGTRESKSSILTFGNSHSWLGIVRRHSMPCSIFISIYHIATNGMQTLSIIRLGAIDNVVKIAIVMRSIVFARFLFLFDNTLAIAVQYHNR